jgi:hypothetical protein
MHRAVIIKAQDTPFDWITTNADEADAFVKFMESRGYNIVTDSDFEYPRHIDKIKALYSSQMLQAIVKVNNPTKY